MMSDKQPAVTDANDRIVPATACANPLTRTLHDLGMISGNHPAVQGKDSIAVRIVKNFKAGSFDRH